MLQTFNRITRCVDRKLRFLESPWFALAAGGLAYAYVVSVIVLAVKS